MRLHDFLEYWARERPDETFAVFQGRHITYAQASAQTNRLANGLMQLGIEPGDRLAILATNRVDYVLLYFAASKAGVVPVPLNYRLLPTAWQTIIADAKTRLVIAAGEYGETLEAMRSDLSCVAHWMSLDPTDIAGWHNYEPWVAAQSDQPCERVVTTDDALYQMYTSGTTGQPKGAILTQGAVTANVTQIALVHQGAPGERSLVVLPLFHAAAVPMAFAPVAWGATLYIMETFEPTEVLRVLREDAIGFATLVPTMIQACVHAAMQTEQYTYQHLRTLYYGASPIAESTLRQAMQVFPCGFVQSYGMTEATQAVTFLAPNDHRRALQDRPALLLSAGRPVMGTEIRIVDTQGRTVPTGTTGEIVVRGPQLMQGYWQRPEDTAAALRHGWLHTGDIGCLDSEGYLYVQDRLKDMIVSGGENVYPHAVEHVLMQHPHVAEAAVIGVPDPRWGETVKALVVPKPNLQVSATELIEFCRSRLAGFTCPRSVDVCETLPHNASGKVLKRVLREPYWADHHRRVAGA